MENMPPEPDSRKQDIANLCSFWGISPYVAEHLLKACHWDTEQAGAIMELIRRAEFRDDRGWRLTPKEELFEPPRRDDTTDFPPAVIASDQIMRMLADGCRIDQDRLAGFVGVLSDSIVSHETDPLVGYESLSHALHADYAYYDADRHLDGFQEGMLYGMILMAESVTELLHERDGSFFPASVLLHPDVLLASTSSYTMDVGKLSQRLGMEPDDVIRAIVDLEREHVVIGTIMGRRRFFFPSHWGAGYAGRLEGMIGRELGDAGGDVDETTRRMSELADFAEDGAIRRAVEFVATQTKKPDPDAGDPEGRLRQVWVPDWSRTQEATDETDEPCEVPYGR